MLILMACVHGCGCWRATTIVVTIQRCARQHYHQPSRSVGDPHRTDATSTRASPRCTLGTTCCSSEARVASRSRESPPASALPSRRSTAGGHPRSTSSSTRRPTTRAAISSSQTQAQPSRTRGDISQASPGSSPRCPPEGAITRDAAVAARQRDCFADRSELAVFPDRGEHACGEAVGDLQAPDQQVKRATLRCSSSAALPAARIAWRGGSSRGAAGGVAAVPVPFIGATPIRATAHSPVRWKRPRWHQDRRPAYARLRRSLHRASRGEPTVSACALRVGL